MAQLFSLLVIILILDNLRRPREMRAGKIKSLKKNFILILQNFGELGVKTVSRLFAEVLARNVSFFLFFNGCCYSPDMHQYGETLERYQPIAFGGGDFKAWNLNTFSMGQSGRPSIFKYFTTEIVVRCFFFLKKTLVFSLKWNALISQCPHSR